MRCIWRIKLLAAELKNIPLTQEQFNRYMDDYENITDEQILRLIQRYPDYAEEYANSIMEEVNAAGVPGPTPEITEKMWQEIQKRIMEYEERKKF